MVYTLTTVDTHEIVKKFAKVVAEVYERIIYKKMLYLFPETLLGE